MKILKKLIETVPNISVDEVIIGVYSILVKAGKYEGIASTIQNPLPHKRVMNAGSITKMSLRELAEFSLSDNLIEASIGMSAINSVASFANNNFKKINAKNIILEKGRDKNVGVIGHFPFLEDLKNDFKRLRIFEKQPRENDLPEKEIPKYLPDSDVVALTATSLTNHTFEKIMQSVKKESFVVMLGPSTPLSPILFGFGIDVISGTLITDYSELKKFVTQATPTRFLKGREYVTIFKKDFQD
ncbi:MAG: DUF364 domain-containing protein [Candidatus Marinimicrobia bacterium]|nr:DUF364 domain-containing protein [Candidatus Neomarinimicrobiota bacterium]